MPNGTSMKRLFSTSQTEQFCAWAAPALSAPAITRAALVSALNVCCLIVLTFHSWLLNLERLRGLLPLLRGAKTVPPTPSQFGLISPGQSCSPTSRRMPEACSDISCAFTRCASLPSCATLIISNEAWRYNCNAPT